MKSVIETSLDRFNGARTITIKFYRGGGIDPVSFLQTIRDIKKEIIWISLVFLVQSDVVCVVVCFGKVHHRHQQCTLVHVVSK